MVINKTSPLESQSITPILLTVMLFKLKAFVVGAMLLSSHLCGACVCCKIESDLFQKEADQRSLTSALTVHDEGVFHVGKDGVLRSLHPNGE